MENSMDIGEQIQFLESYISTSERQISLLTQGIEEYGKALAVLEDKSIIEAKESMMSLGGGIFVKCRMENTNTALVAIGSDIFIEEEKEKTIERLKKHIDELRKSIEKLNLQRMDAIKRYNSMISEINRVSSKNVSEGKAGKDIQK